MEYRRFGKTGVEVSVFTLGGMRFLHGWDTPHDHLPAESIDNVRALMQRAFDAGINLVETARGYGKSERLIGRALPQVTTPRDRFRFMTKASPQQKGSDTRRMLEESLSWMGLERVDFFAIHGINTPDLLALVLKKRGTLEALQKAQEEGLIGHLGFSTHGPLPVILRAMASGAFAFVNLHYYFFKRENRAALALARSRDMGVFIISPNDKGGTLYTPPQALTALTDPVHPVLLNERWLLRQPEVHSLSIGMSVPEHLDIHLDTLQRPWGVEEDEAARRLHAVSSASPMRHCGECRRCLPCPLGIEIPDVLRYSHLETYFGMDGYARYRYGQMQAGDHWMPGAKVDVCDRCGECTRRCPQWLVIPDLLAHFHRRMKGARSAKND